jgi:hypothetical protein
MSDKWCRLTELASGKTPQNESLRDSLVDLSVYALLCVVLIDEIPVPLPKTYDQIQAEAVFMQCELCGTPGYHTHGGTTCLRCQ